MLFSYLLDTLYDLRKLGMPFEFLYKRCIYLDPWNPFPKPEKVEGKGVTIGYNIDPVRACEIVW